ncbi:Uncharacterised protein [Escherichia coli]|uniref:Uncharacterized protein n=1 Tax=Escherichia coli TaxID=562 RepID=A0A376UG80_ECOLX|nr:Uncharacterised protein [Escherichia coli]
MRPLRERRFYGQAGDLFRCREHRGLIYVETEIGIGAGDHFRAAIVSILAHLSDQNARATTIVGKELLRLRTMASNSEADFSD